MEWTSFIDVIDGIYEVRISDNFLDTEDWGTNIIRIHNGKVVISVTNVTVGIYDIPDMYGWTVADIQEWLSYDPDWNHPENYHEIRAL